MSLDKKTILSIIEQSIQEVNEFRTQDNKVSFSEDLILFGPESSIDSLDLVTVITDVEEALYDQYDLRISLTDDRALSHIPSPFESVTNLASYIVLAAGDAAEDPQ